MGDHPQPGAVLHLKFAQNCGRVVLAAVIHYDDFKLASKLLQHAKCRGDEIGKRWCIVVRREEHGEALGRLRGHENFSPMAISDWPRGRFRPARSSSASTVRGA